MKAEEIKMDMPTPCQRCGNIFELNDGSASEKWYPNTIICDSCASEEEDEIQLDDEIEELKTNIEDAKITIKDNTEILLSLGVKITTPQPQPTMAAVEMKEVKQQLAIENGFEHWRDYVLDCTMNDLAKDIQDDYEDEPFDEVARRLFKGNQPTSFTPPRTEQEEADRLVVLVSSISMSSLSECKVIAQVFTSEKITSLQLRGLSTTFEEKVLTILKGM